MKLKYIIPSLVAVIAMLVSCSDKFEASYLDGLRVSSSYLSLSADGSSMEFIVQSADSWEIQGVPDWLTVSPMSGNAGRTEVTISAGATTSSQTATIKLVSGGQVQELNVIQTAKKSEPVIISVAQALAQIKESPDGSSAAVRGIVCKIDEISTQYGNATYYLSDDGKYGDGNWVEIYRGYWLDGAKFTAGDEFAVGDELVVEGTVVLYNGSVPEFTAGSSVVSISKSLIGIEKVEMLDVEEGEGKTEFTKEGGKAKITITTKGNGFHISIPAEAKSWLHIDDFGAEYVTLAADANDGAARKATVTLSTESEGTTYTCEQTFTQEANVLPHGENPDDPFNVAEAIAKCQAIGSTSDGVIYYAKGIISSISSVDTGSYGNATFNISDNGEDVNTITVYRSYFLNNEKFTAENQIGVGDEVVITGKLVNYTKNNVTTPEFSGSVYVYSIKKASNDPGTKNNPFTISQVISFIDGGGTGEVYVKGVVSELVSGGFSANFGNGTFWISDDGTKYGDQTKDFEAYRVYWLGNQKWVDGNDQIAVGDKVVLCGEVTKYTNSKTGAVTYETSQNKAYVFSVNGKTN